jgi:hypothetical protein
MAALLVSRFAESKDRFVQPAAFREFLNNPLQQR